MLDLEYILANFIRNIEPDTNRILEYFNAYQVVVDKFGYAPIIQPGQIHILGWDLEYRCGAALATSIDQILVRRLNDFIPENDHPLILDCGANIGFSSLSYKRQFPNAKIIAFEPDPEFAPVLQRNLERNGAGDVEVVDAAIWVENGTSQWRCEGIDGSHLSAETGETAKTTTVRTVDLCDYLNKPVDLIKMDIEGAEYEVINHVGKKLKNVKAMSIECHLRQTTIVPFSKILKVLSAAGFKLSINSFGGWSDLIRQTPVLVDHHENYILVSAWRGSIPAAFKHSSWIPNAGIAPTRDFDNQIKYIIKLTSAREVELVKAASARETELTKAASARETELLEYLKSYALSGEKALKRIQLKEPYQQITELCWVVQLEDFLPYADNEEHPYSSTLLVYEDDKLLQPAHTIHEDIRNLGGGRYSHWNKVLYFSTSDGSDPNTNGRAYRIICIV
jgi:FkbM family methyltransferase